MAGVRGRNRGELLWRAGSDNLTAAAAAFWAIVMRVAWPTELEEWAEGDSDNQEEGGSK